MHVLTDCLETKPDTVLTMMMMNKSVGAIFGMQLCAFHCSVILGRVLTSGHSEDGLSLLGSLLDPQLQVTIEGHADDEFEIVANFLSTVE